MITFFRNGSNDEESLSAKSSDKNSNQIYVIEGTTNETSLAHGSKRNSKVTEIIATSELVLGEDIVMESNESEIKKDRTNRNITLSKIPIEER